jgi:CLIP-associating protein 1/2
MTTTDTSVQLTSLRTTLASNTCSLYTELAVALGPRMDPFAEPLFGALLNMAGYTKKIVAQQTQTAVDVFIECLSPLARTVIPFLTRYMTDKNVQTRTFMATHVKQYIEVNGTRAKSSLESAGHVDALENLVKKGLVDTNPAAREASRQAFWSFSVVWPARAAVILASLESGNRKHVEKACPDPTAPHVKGVLGSVSSSAASEVPKKSSLAAAIAASRAKAKAIAIAPPTLIHQATSASHMQAASSKLSSPTRADSSSLSSKSQEAGGSSRNPASPMKIARAVSNGFKPSTSNATSPRGRIPSQTIPPLSPRSSADDSKKRLSATFTPTTPEHGRSGTFQRAITTPLPASPPRPPTVVTTPTPRNIRQIVRINHLRVGGSSARSQPNVDHDA